MCRAPWVMFNYWSSISGLRTKLMVLHCVLQVLGTLFIYVLFMVEEFRKEPVENMDDVIYYVNGTYRLLEFLVALCVVAYGVSETVFGEWTVMGSVIIFIHSYYNVWLRAQLGWKSFLLRRDAVNKIKSLPTATKEQLEQHNDICAICYQVRIEVSKCWLEFKYLWTVCSVWSTADRIGYLNYV